jgi:hypothetical protein
VRQRGVSLVARIGHHRERGAFRDAPGRQRSTVTAGTETGLRRILRDDESRGTRAAENDEQQRRHEGAALLS